MTRRMTHEEYVGRVYALVGEEYTVTGKYTRSATKIEMKHNVCGEPWEITPNNFLTKNKRCPHCAGKRKFKTHRQFIKDVKEKSKGKLEVVGTYTHCETPVKVRCKIHDFVFDKLPTSILRGRTVCLKCNLSSGALTTYEYLEKEGIIFEVEKEFDECRLERNLRFDFYIPSLELLIEYDGRQHSEDGGFKGKRSSLSAIRARDRIKTKFAKDYGYRLLRIPHTLSDLEIVNILHEVKKEYLQAGNLRVGLQGSKAEALKPNFKSMI
jgi:very-short-patch-repair endonuclease